MLLRTVLEIGGLGGYSAVNFCKAVGPTGLVYSIDLNPLPVVAPNHRVVVKDARDLSRADLPDVPAEGLDLVFFDCHDYDVQMELFEQLVADGLVHEDTVIVMHDTNTHPYQAAPWVYPAPDGRGWVHCPAERRMVNELRVHHGYEALNVHTRLERHSDALPYRHGLSILSKPRVLSV
jgi:predicted O-methyltransferase YrrM